MSNREKIFDRLSDDYNEEFSYSGIGKRLWKRVWAHLEIALKEHGRTLRGLELSGTDLDGPWRIDKGGQVVSTVISSLMLQAAKARSDEHGSETNE